MGYPIRQYQTAQPLLFLLVSSADHRLPITGAAPTVVISKNGGGFAAPAGAITEVGNGWYQVAGSATDSSTLGSIALHATAASADPADEEYDVVGVDQQLGPTLEQFDTLTPLLFLLIASNDHITGLTGATPTVVISKNGGAFSAPMGTVVGVGNGWYALFPGSSDVGTEGPLILHATAVNADPQDTTYDVIPAFEATPSQLTIADVLDIMEILDNELEVQAGEADEGRAITALNMALMQFDTIASMNPGIEQQTGGFSCRASGEFTTWPLNLLRLDALWRLDAATGDQVYELENLQHAGGHTYTNVSNWLLALSVAGPLTGAPIAFAASGRRFYWAPKPDAIYPFRAYGYFRSPRARLRTNGWYHGDELMLPAATMAVRMMSLGVGDDDHDLQTLAGQVYSPLVRSLRKAVRLGPTGRVYTQWHTT